MLPATSVVLGATAAGMSVGLAKAAAEEDMLDRYRWKNRLLHDFASFAAALRAAAPAADAAPAPDRLTRTGRRPDRPPTAPLDRKAMPEGDPLLPRAAGAVPPGTGGATLPVRLCALDVDGTVLAGDSQTLLAGLMIEQGLAPRRLMLRVAMWFALYRLGAQLDVAHLQQRMIGAFAGTPAARIEAIFDRCVAERLAPRVRADARRAIARLRAEEDCRIVLVSASLAPLVERLSVLLGADGAVATQLAPPVDGRFSGRIEGKMVYGAHKLAALSAHADARYGRWVLWAAYGDHESDAPLLAAAKTAVAVHPTLGLRRLSAARGWTVAAWR